MIICVLGPTGVGKTKLSEALAQKYDAIIVNADAMQVYKYLNIGTAKIKESEMVDKPHYLFDIKNPDEEYSVYNYQKDARRIIDQNSDKNIILVGGTGLYVKAALYNYEFNEFQEKNEYEEYSNEELYELLEKRGLSQNIDAHNRRRMVSKLNSGVVSNKKDEPLYGDIVLIGLTTDREGLYKRINDRVDEMVSDGLLEEVKNLYQNHGKVKSLNTGIGYKEVIAYLEGKMTWDETVRLIKQRSRKYAKRQYTWFNYQMNVKWFSTDYDDFARTIKEVEDYIDTLN